MAEVVGVELQLEAVGGHLPLGEGHHAGVVDEDVEPVVPARMLGEGDDAARLARSRCS